MWPTSRSISRLLGPLAAAAVLLWATPSRAARFRGGSTGSGAADGVAADEARVTDRELTTRRPIRKPVTDKREYLYTTFDSGLRVLAVQDPEAEKSSFAVAVEAGSLEDPPDFQGLAHFCEHMVFLGSQKYPDKDAFSAQLALHGGTHNAYTADEETVYFGEIGAEGLDKALDIFAQFFIAPSFKKEMVDKEIHAVDSEHKKNQPDTQRRLWHLLHSKANPSNPTHLFKTGDLETLKEKPESQNKSLVEALQAFHRRNYCPGRLHLVLVANSSTEELLALGHRHFDALPRAAEGACAPRPVYYAEPAYSLQLGNLGRRFTVGTHGAPQLWLMLPTLPLQPHYKELAETYLWHALGHYGPGSLKALLLREDLSQSYSFYAENSVAGSMILVSFALTEKGAKHTDTILEYFFAYIKAVKDAGVDERLLSNMRQLRQVEFDYQEKHPSEFDFVSSLGGSLPKYASEDVLTGGILIDKPNVELIKQVLASLAPGNMNVILVDPSFNESAASHHEQYYDFGYEEVAIEMPLLARLGKASGHGLVPPPDLQYVPRKLQLISEPSPGEEGPRRLLERGRVELWWLGLGEVRLPKAVVSVKLGFPPSAMSGVRERVLASLHARLVQLVLEEPSDALQTCGLTYSVSAASDGMGISFMGFDEHFLDLVQMVMPRLRSPGSSEADFEKARRQLLLDLADVTRLQPYQHAMEAFEVVSMKDRFSRSEMIEAAQDATMVNSVAHRKFLAAAFAEAQLSILFAGNIGSERASEMTVAMEQALGITRDLPEVVHESHEQVIDPQGEVELRVANPIAGDPNSATLVAYQFGVPEIADRVHLAMLGEVMDRPVFEALRTERQLGYVVFGYVAPHASIVEVRVLVQGFREAPDRVEGLIEGTVQNLTEAIAKMSPKEFETRKHALRTALSKKAATMAQFAGQYWGQIWDQTYCFQKRSLELQYLDSQAFNSSQPLLEAWKRAVAPQTGSRRKISVKLFGAKAVQAIALDKARQVDKKVITLANSGSVGKELQGEHYWPHSYVCK
mmetsp:Transcript_23328/g.66415  ORF Transcript_23328/g.66415 Transcript_23328/m.66415 type:complete len:1027 (-) Transcript_23328:134-3214(-)